ncbi:SIS domain-containing protein [Lactococcus hircilactis]|uniref:SIS domain-containing protein n=1 Tax=Lactococcus hircilactis TaxID=1494462 RepID=A0A7X1Z880_9LACT|nr:MurR/RpiR family transcriptional regulator [Lactococcus hircilactis]MQW38552.1 SIS domain-containing protein [Lactococcus hircilactis]
MGFFGNIDFQNLTYTERVIYNYLKNNTDKIPYMHVREIATQAHAGSSSVMRLIHKMGYNSFNEFKTYLKKNEINAYNETNFYQFSLKDYPDNLSDILEDMARQIVESDHLIFTGIGASGLICDYASRRFAGIGINSFSFSDVTYPIASKLRNTVDTFVIALSISGETNEIIEVLTQLRTNKDITIASITGRSKSTIADLSDIVLPYIVEERRVDLHFDLSSQLPAVFLIEQLSELVYRKMKE